MNVLIAKAIAVALLVAGLIFGFNVFVEHQRDIGYQKRVARAGSPCTKASNTRWRWAGGMPAP